MHPHSPGYLASLDSPAHWLPLGVLAAWCAALLYFWPRVPPERRLRLAPLVVILALLSLENASALALAGGPMGEDKVPDPVRIWKMPPNSAALETNSQGFRNAGEIGPRTGPRVLCVGDSWTFGKSVARAEAWPSRVADLTGYEVVNAGGLGYCSYQAWLTLLDPGFSLDPDVVVMGTTRNSGGLNSFTGLSVGAEDARRLLFLSDFYLWLRREYQKASIAARARAGGAEKQVSPTEELRIHDSMVDACRRRGIEVVYLVVRDEAGDGGRVQVDEPLRFARSRALPTVVVDMSDPSLRGVFDKVHPNPEGHGILAEAVAPAVREAMERKLGRREAGPSSPATPEG